MQYSSYADISCSTNPDAHCSHATNENCYESIIYKSGRVILENLHHKNISNIMARMTFLNVESAVKLTYIGHLYGAPDHYDMGGVPGTEEMQLETGNNGFNRNCIYGEDKDEPDVAENLIICDGCKDEILSNRNRFNH